MHGMCVCTCGRTCVHVSMLNASSFEIVNTNENGGNDAVIVVVRLYWNGQNMFGHQLLGVYL